MMMLEGSNTLPGWGIVPNIAVRDVDLAVQFYQKAFGSEVILRHPKPDGSISHARLRIGNSLLILSSDDRLDGVTRTGSPSTLENTSVSLELFVDDFDGALERALLAGAEMSKAPETEACIGDRVCSLVDPFGHRWMLSTFIDDSGALCI